MHLLLAAAILVNGVLAPNEWRGAKEVDLGSGYTLLLREDRAYLYLAIRFPNAVRHSGLELYVQDAAGHESSFHVSGALGRRERRGTEWGDYDWANRWWTANGIGMVVEEGKTRVLAPEAFELQFEKRGFRPARVRIELRRPAIAFPADTTRWIVLERRS